jgi:hypothetical protein
VGLNSDFNDYKLIHYHHQDEPPFQNLSALTTIEALAVIERLRPRSGAVYRRFADPEAYLQQRRSTERWLRQEFVQQGGKPQSAYPHYFVVGRSTWIEAGFEGEYRLVELPIGAFPAKAVSFTYTDSMISDWLRSQTDQVFYQPEYHGRVFGLSEIGCIIDKFGLPGEAWRSEPNRRYDLFIEAQVWLNDVPRSNV